MLKFSIGRDDRTESADDVQNARVASSTSIDGLNGNADGIDGDEPISGRTASVIAVNHQSANRMLSLPHFPDRSPLRSSLVKDGSRRNSPARKTVSFTRMPTEKRVSNVSDCLALMTSGADLTKVRANTRQYRRHFTLDADFSYLRWTPTNKKPHKAKICVSDIKEIRIGRNTDVLRSSDTCVADMQDDCAFSIIYGDMHDCLDLVASGPDEASIWVTGLMALTSGNLPPSVALNKSGSMVTDVELGGGNGADLPSCSSATVRERWLADQFNKSIKDGDHQDGYLSEKAAVRLVKQLNPQLSTNRIKLKFKEVEASKTEEERGRVRLHEFIDAYRDVATRPEIYFLMVRYANKDYLTWDDLQLFLENEQGIMNVTQELCHSIIHQYEPSEEGRDTDTMTVDGFTQYLLSDECALFDPSHRSPCQDMTQPLNDYFVAASHNTYLVEDQLKGPSSIDGYISALKRGCRFIELDVWESETEQGMFIYHGHTQTSKLAVSKALPVIKEYAFESSLYPLIIKLEQHVGIPNQIELAHQLRETFQPHLLTGETFMNGDGQECLPSPQSLKGKILIMGKRLPSECSDNAGEVTDEDESAETQRSMTRQKRIGSRRIHPLSRELSNLVCPFLQSVTLKDLCQTASLSGAVHACSLNESLCLRAAHQNATEFSGLSRRFLCRVYPNAVRVDSSNMNPQEFWNFGVQLVALNYQTPGLMMDLQDGKFLANGGCGYVLKPPIMRRNEPGDVSATAALSTSTTADDNLPLALTPQILHLKVISGQQLPRPRGSTAKGDSSDPFVVVEVFGIPIDCAEERTKTVKNDSFNPSFDESFQFQVTVPELALIRFLVLDDDYIGDDFIGQYTLPFDCLQSGYRHINLVNNEGEQMEGVTLFVHVAITNRRGGGKPKKRGMSVKRKTQRVHTGVKMIGVKQLDELFKSAIVPLAECIQLRSALEASLTEWQEQCGLGQTGTMRQGLRLLNTRVQVDAGPAGQTSSEEEEPHLEVWIDENEFPHVNCKGPPPEQLLKQLSCLEDLLGKGRNILQKMEQLLQKLEEATHRIGESYEDLTNLCISAGLKGQKATRATENFAWNLRLLKAQLDLMYRTQQEVKSTNQQVIDSACVLGILRVKCVQPCIHQPQSTRITI